MQAHIREPLGKVLDGAVPVETGHIEYTTEKQQNHLGPLLCDLQHLFHRPEYIFLRHAEGEVGLVNEHIADLLTIAMLQGTHSVVPSTRVRAKEQHMALRHQRTHTDDAPAAIGRTAKTKLFHQRPSIRMSASLR